MVQYYSIFYFLFLSIFCCRAMLSRSLIGFCRVPLNPQTVYRMAANAMSVRITTWEMLRNSDFGFGLRLNL